MNKLLKQYIDNSSDPIINFKIGRWYETLGHVSPAISFYLRCADRADDINLRYDALIRMFICYDKSQGRDYTSETTLKQAVSLCPNRIEAYYFLCQFYEYRGNYIESFTNASIAISLLSQQKKIMPNIEYPGNYAFYFLKAHSAWHIGKPDDARKIYRYVLENMVDQLSGDYKKLLQQNLSVLGSGNPSKSSRRYKKKKHKLKYHFKGCEDIEQNFSQTYQDICTLTLLDGKKNGTYLEIGSADPFYGSNTALLEQLGWKGVGVEYGEQDYYAHKAHRKNPVLCKDALELDYQEILDELSPDSNIIDYLQLDIEPSKNTFFALTLMPFDKYKFRFITYEHDHYADVSKSFREKSRQFLHSLGYELLINDISPFDNHPYEDWWYHPDIVDPERVKMIKHVDLDKVHNVEDIFLD